MFCQNCGKENAFDVKFCGNCGASTSTLAGVAATMAVTGVPGDQMTFAKAISTCLAKYFDFKGRASRPEYWWFYLFVTLLSWGAMIVDKTDVLSAIINLALLIPVLSAGARRLHDTNRSGWWQLLMITIIGLIPLIIWMASKGDDHDNDYGRPV